MFKKIINKLAYKIGSEIQVKVPKSHFISKSESELLALGSLLSNQQNLLNFNKVNDYEFKIFSQWGDDGIIQYLIKNIKIENEVFIEFGVEDYSESNTRFLMMNNNWGGYILDSSKTALERLKKRDFFWKYDLRVKEAFITKNNINKLISDSGLQNIGILSIDIDGNDFYILEEINFEKINPSILILEYNAVFGNERSISVPYNEDFYRTSAHYSNLFFGASLPALKYLANLKGYALVTCTKSGNNAYFVRRDLLNDKVKELSLDEAFILSKFRESRNIEGKLSYVDLNERYNLIKGMEVYDVISRKNSIL